MPQLIEQWRMKSAEGIAIGFISIWFTGDVLNLIGALWAGLLPEVIFLAIWFCIADFLMIASYFYYTRVYPKHHHRVPHPNSEHTPTSPDTQPLLRRRSSTLTDIAVDPLHYSIFAKYVVPILFIIAAGVGGFFLGGSGSGSGDDGDSPIELGPQIVGYLSALLYLGARIPQIIQNHKRRSVEGLSLLFFMFSTLGNLTYAGQILFYRTDRNYLMLNLSWLIGSLGTIFEDCIIFMQFYLYGLHHDVVEVNDS